MCDVGAFEVHSEASARALRTKRNVLFYIEPGDPTRYRCGLREEAITLCAE